MNNNVFIAKIFWLKPEFGGRQSGIPLNNKKYCPIVAVDGQRHFCGSDFGLLCYSYEKLADYVSLAMVRFLNTEAAPDVLRIGAKLELYEGARKVADGEIIEKSDFVFDF